MVNSATERTAVKLLYRISYHIIWVTQIETRSEHCIRVNLCVVNAVHVDVLCSECRVVLDMCCAFPSLQKKQAELRQHQSSMRTKVKNMKLQKLQGAHIVVSYISFLRRVSRTSADYTI